MKQIIANREKSSFSMLLLHNKLQSSIIPDIIKEIRNGNAHRELATQIADVIEKIAMNKYNYLTGHKSVVDYIYYEKKMREIILTDEFISKVIGDIYVDDQENLHTKIFKSYKKQLELIEL